MIKFNDFIDGFNARKIAVSADTSDPDFQNLARILEEMGYQDSNHEYDTIIELCDHWHGRYEDLTAEDNDLVLYSKGSFTGSVIKASDIDLGNYQAYGDQIDALLGGLII